jgi:hypothetical protein
MTTTYSDAVFLNVRGDGVVTVGANVPVRVNLAGTSTYATLTDKDGAVLTNPFNSGVNGNYLFKVEDGLFDIIINEGQPSEYTIPEVKISDSSRLTPYSVIGTAISIDVDNHNEYLILEPTAAATITLDSAIAGTMVFFRQGNAFSVTFAAGAGVTLLSPVGYSPYTLNSTVVAFAESASTWVLSGELG